MHGPWCRHCPTSDLQQRPAQERREIERALFTGELWAVAATNALELGVDVGSLDCTLHLGFPGSVASLWQQVGPGLAGKASWAFSLCLQHFLCVHERGGSKLFGIIISW